MEMTSLCPTPDTTCKFQWAIRENTKIRIVLPFSHFLGKSSLGFLQVGGGDITSPLISHFKVEETNAPKSEDLVWSTVSSGAAHTHTHTPISVLVSIKEKERGPQLCS